MNPELFQIPGPWRGKLSVVTRPRGGDWLDDEVQGWQRAGVDVVVSLLEPDEAAQLELDHEGEAAKQNGIQFLSFPIPDRDVPASTPAALTLLKRIVSDLEQGKSVAIHCRQSIGRSGLVAAGVLVLTGVSSARAIEVVARSRGLTIPETPAQLRWIHQLAPEPAPSARTPA